MVQAHSRIMNEWRQLINNPVPGIAANPIGYGPDGMFKWCASIYGPEGTPYAGGLFLLSYEFPPNYPFKPPMVKFLTPVFHPNVDRENGDIGIDILRNQWSQALTVSTVLLSISSFLADPNPNPPNCNDGKPPMEPVIADLYNANREEFNATAKTMTEEEAM